MILLVQRNGQIKGKLREVLVESDIYIGDYVIVEEPGYQYGGYTQAFKYFWGNSFTVDFYKVPKTDRIWKVINMVAHSSHIDQILCHI